MFAPTFWTVGENLGATAEMREYKAVYGIGDVEVGLESDVAAIAVP